MAKPPHVTVSARRALGEAEAGSELEFHRSTWLGEGSSFGTNEKGWEALDIRKGSSKTEQDLHQLGKDIGAWMSYLVGFRAVYAIRECSSHLSNMLRTSCLTFQSLIQFFLEKQRYEGRHGRRKEVNAGLRFY